MKKINITLIFIFLLSACTLQADLPVKEKEDDSKILDLKTETPTIEEPEPEVIKKMMETKNDVIEGVIK